MRVEQQPVAIATERGHEGNLSVGIGNRIGIAMIDRDCTTPVWILLRARVMRCSGAASGLPMKMFHCWRSVDPRSPLVVTSAPNTTRPSGIIEGTPSSVMLPPPGAGIPTAMTRTALPLLSLA